MLERQRYKVVCSSWHVIWRETQHFTWNDISDRKLNSIPEWPIKYNYEWLQFPVCVGTNSNFSSIDGCQMPIWMKRKCNYFNRLINYHYNYSLWLLLLLLRNLVRKMKQFRIAVHIRSICVTCFDYRNLLLILFLSESVGCSDLLLLLESIWVKCRSNK